MTEFLERLSHVDFDSAARNLFAFLENADPCFLGLIVGVLVFLGSRMVSGQPSLQSWGLRLAVTAFLAHGGYLWFSGKLEDGTPLWRHGARSAAIAGIVLAVAWIVLPVLSFVHRRLRLALAVFLGYGGYVAIAGDEPSGEQLSVAALHGLAAASLALVIAWIVDPLWTPFARHFFPAKSPEDKPVDEPMDSRPIQVRTAMIAPAPVILNNLETASDAQRRRDRARMQLELVYLQAMPTIGAWMPRPLFDDFLRRHLGDHLSAEDVEDNARQLLLVLRQHKEQVQERGEFTTLEELAGWLLSEQQRIQSQPVDLPLKQTQLLDLHQRYLVLATRMVQKTPSLPC
jgi:hypothetical protein